LIRPERRRLQQLTATPKYQWQQMTTTCKCPQSKLQNSKNNPTTNYNHKTLPQQPKNTATISKSPLQQPQMPTATAPKLSCNRLEVSCNYGLRKKTKK
jgi:hypothetical protein